MPKFRSKVKVIQAGNAASVNILFSIPIIITIQGHMFDIYSMVSEMHDNVDWVLGVKDIVELEAEKSIRELKFKFLNGSVPVFPAKAPKANSTWDIRLLGYYEIFSKEFCNKVCVIMIPLNTY